MGTANARATIALFLLCSHQAGRSSGKDAIAESINAKGPTLNRRGEVVTMRFLGAG
jgi:hypothetical protein